MKMFLPICLSTAFHTAVLTGLVGWGESSFMPACVQRGSGSVEVEIIKFDGVHKPRSAAVLTDLRSSVGGAPPSVPASPHRLPPSSLSESVAQHLRNARLVNAVKPRRVVDSGPHSSRPRHGLPEYLLSPLWERMGEGGLHSPSPAPPLPPKSRWTGEGGGKSIKLSDRVIDEVVHLRADPGALGVAPSTLNNPAPRYPRQAILKGWEGETLVKVSINRDGEVEDITVLRSSGYGVLDEAVMKVLKGWRFEKGKARQLQIPFRFLLENEK